MKTAGRITTVKIWICLYQGKSPPIKRIKTCTTRLSKSNSNSFSKTTQKIRSGYTATGNRKILPHKKLETEEKNKKNKKKKDSASTRKKAFSSRKDNRPRRFHSRVQIQKGIERIAKLIIIKESCTNTK